MEAQTTVFSTTTATTSTADNHYEHNKTKTNLSRRSVDWRDSGIVIDEELPQCFNSYETIYSNASQSASSISSVFQQQQGQPTHSSTSTPTTSNTNLCSTSHDGLPFGPDDADGDTILHLAVVGFTVDQVRDLIKLCDLNAINNMMQTPLHVAVLANRPEIVQLLIESGAHVDVYDRKGNTPLHLACQKGHEEIIILILDSGLRFDRQTTSPEQMIGSTNFDGQTCLHLATLNDKRNIIKLLVNVYNANVDCQDNKSGETIMHKAIRHYNIGLVEFILSMPKHCNSADYSGLRPLDTVQLLRDSRIDRSQMQKLLDIENLIRQRIQFCLDTNKNCCRPGHLKYNNAILDSEISSSEYSDSDYELN